MFHHFPSQLKRDDYLVNSTNIIYEENASFTYLIGVSHVGYLLDDTRRYSSKSVPPLEFQYSKFPSDTELSRLQVKDIDIESLQNLPCGIGGKYQWLDLHGEGLCGVLTEEATGWFFKPNLSANNLDERQTISKLGAVEQVFSRPAASEQSFFMDVQGDGFMDLVSLDNNNWVSMADGLLRLDGCRVKNSKPSQTSAREIQT